MDNAKSKGELQKFGLVLAGLTGIIFGLVVPWLFSMQFALWPWLLSFLLLVIAVGAPFLLMPVQRVLVGISMPLGRLNAFILLSTVFFLLICPMGFFMRLFGRDPIRRSFEAEATTYRRKSDPASSMEVPF